MTQEGAATVDNSLQRAPSKRPRAARTAGLKTMATSIPTEGATSPPPLMRKGCGTGPGGLRGNLALNISGSLTTTEAEVFNIMGEAVEYAKSETIVRVAGGWVRDKILGLENDDIDVAVDNMTGKAFAEVVNAFLKFSGQDEAKIAVIEANPEQSKHLETARMKIAGVCVDLVNLRTEVYRPDSRIPDASFGTAEEDALRRDLTLNALFYNVNEAKVEDMTGCGISDLRDGIIRTPLPPLVTFRDDPLRVLRAVRFAARFGFDLHQELRAAAESPETQAALSSKVSRERIGAELCGMLTGKMAQPGLALKLLQELNLAATVYAPPEDLVPPTPDGGFDWARGAAVAHAAADLRTNGEGLRPAQAAGCKAPPDETEDGGALKSEEVSPAVATAGVATVEVIENATAGEDETPAPAAAITPGSDEDKGAGARRTCEHSGSGHTAGTLKLGAKFVEESPGDEIVDGQGAKSIPCTLERELFLSAVLLPLAGVKHKLKKGKLIPAAQSVVQDSLKLKAKEAKNVGDILDFVPIFRKLADDCAEMSQGDVTRPTQSIADGEGSGLSRLAVGLAVREAKHLWPTCVQLCCAIEVHESRAGAPPVRSTSECGVREPGGKSDRPTAANACADMVGGKRARMDALEGDERERAVINKYLRLQKAVAAMGLTRAWELLPLLRGNELASELGVPRGPKIGKLVAAQASWQLEHPQGTREECIAFLREAAS